MNLSLNDVQQAWREKGALLGLELAETLGAAQTIRRAAGVGLLDPQADLLSLVTALDALAAQSVPSAMALALHIACARSLGNDSSLASGERVGALTLATDQVPTEYEGRLNGRASWVAPLAARGVALVGARRGVDLVACAVELSSPGVTVEPVTTAGLPGVVMGHLALTEAPCSVLGMTLPVMARARLFIAAVGLGIARRAVREALGSARGTSQGAGGEQTAQGLIADAATDLDAAMLLTWKAATQPLSLGLASMAKLAATVAAQRAVERATQVVGAESFREGHVIERLTQDVRALELFAGRTEALREAVAVEWL